MEQSSSAASQLQRFLTAFHSSHSPPALSTPPTITAASVTGVAFLLNNAAFEVLIEAPTATLFTLLTTIHSHQTTRPNSSSSSSIKTPPPPAPLPPRSLPSTAAPASPSPSISSLKVLSFIEDVPRTFPFFTVRALRVPPYLEDWPNPSPSYSSTPTSSTGGGGGGVGAGQWQAPSVLGVPPHAPSGLLPLVWGTVQGMLALGGEVRGMGAGEGEEFVQAGGRAVVEKVVSVERVVGYGQCGELMDVDDFLDCFVRRQKGKPESERVWPVEQFGLRPGGAAPSAVSQSPSL